VELNINVRRSEGLALIITGPPKKQKKKRQQLANQAIVIARSPMHRLLASLSLSTSFVQGWSEVLEEV